MHDNRQLTTLSLLELRVAICKQLKVAPYLSGVHSISLGHLYYEETVPAVRGAGQPPCALVWLQTNDRGLWFGNETTSAHAYNI